ncbi:uncharacterized protein PAC_07560 [Phialocephala subalpina]|uniref:Uncharacterized protein n=1 Tax=Phialocephala subalpina TaxID=576137 RepID=A0A1L7WY25_9HELO|nr:uncharacterized protein PAC_07560 [Phialocephala subalpina]
MRPALHPRRIHHLSSLGRVQPTRPWRTPRSTQYRRERGIATSQPGESGDVGEFRNQKSPDNLKGNTKQHKNDTRDDPTLGSKMLESAATAFASILVLGTGFGLGGYFYHKFYKWLVLHKMEGAFEPGDPVLELASIGKQMPSSIASKSEDDDHWIQRDEQAKIDAIVNGTLKGHYHLLIGEKGTGKSSMLLEAMQKINGEGCSMFEAHADSEIFRVRLGKALDFEFHEDYIGSYFSERGPRDTTALLDIERAFNKLEKIALKRRKTVGKPLIMIINAVHLLRDDDDGRDLLELLQQRAEQWAASNLVTIIFNSDDYWVYERLKQLATRMEITQISDLPKSQAMSALARYRQKYFQETPSSDILSEVYSRVGGRLTFLNRVAKSKDMLETCDKIIDTERRWFLNQCWILGMEMDDDVMDQQKYASAAMVLAQALVRLENSMSETISPDDGSHIIPQIPLHLARQIMTRADFIKSYDPQSAAMVLAQALVRLENSMSETISPDDGSHIIPQIPLHLARQIMTRADFIKSYDRELPPFPAKDLVLGGRYLFKNRDGERRGEKITEVELKQAEEEEEEDFVEGILKKVRGQEGGGDGEVED